MTGVPRFFGAVEAGGTKFIVAVGDERGQILARERFPTTDPQTSLAAAKAILRRQADKYGVLAAIGVASFGPVELDKSSERHGFIGRTPKSGWSGTDIAGAFARDFACPIG